VIGREDLFFLGFRIANLRIEDTALATLLATILLLAFGIMSVLDNLLAWAMRTLMSDDLANHVVEFNTSFEF
jgi:hypothetical protein